jgi:mannose-6-phosphate isomerase-like protein (cupin superfamily)
MKPCESSIGRRQFVRGLGGTAVVTVAAVVPGNVSAQEAPAAKLLHADEGLRIPTPDGRVVTIKVDSAANPGVRMSMITEDIPPNAAIAVHLHQREDETIFIRTGSGIATLGEREVRVQAGATIYVPQGTWHGLRNDGTETLGMSAVFSPPGFEQIFKDRLVRPNRSPAETAAHRKKFGIVYRTP